MSLRGRLMVTVVLALALARSGAAASFTVDTTVDAIDANPGNGVCATAAGGCSLRAAVIETNALPGPDVVSIPAGTYLLAIPGSNEDFAATGDLDIRDDLTLEGVGALVTRLNGGGLDFVISARGPRVALRRMVIRGGLGAGVSLDDTGGAEMSTELSDVVIRDNDGDGIFGETNGLTIVRSVIRDNQGAGAYVWFVRQPALVEDTWFINNHGAFPGGGLALSFGFGEAVVRRSLVSLNSPGGIAITEKSLIVEDSRIDSNTQGAGVLLASENAARIARTTIEHNDGPEAGGLLLPESLGGAGPVLVLDSAIVGNTSSTGAGGIKNARRVPSSLQLVNTTVSGNSGVTGGGLAAQATIVGQVSLLNCTVTDNSATRGGGIALLEPSGAVGSNTVTLHNTILADNHASTSGPDCFREGPSAMEFVSAGHNLIGDLTDCELTPAPSDLVGLAPAVLDPLLDVLEPDALSTPVHHLGPGSPAIDAGDDSGCPTADQLGEPRPLDGNADGVAQCDIGAVEESSGDADADTFANDVDNCPTIPNPGQSDRDADGVGDACDNCTTVGNPRVALAVSDAYEYFVALPWATLTGGQRDDDHDGFGNVCDGDFSGASGQGNVGPADTAQFRASIGRFRTTDTCGTNGMQPCAFFDLNLDQNTDAVDHISPADVARFRDLIGLPAGPGCLTCPLACSAGPDGSCF